MRYKLLNKSLIFLPTLLLTCFLQGCMFVPREQPEPSFFDLGMPKKPQIQKKFRIIIFENATPCRTRMLQRQADNRIVQDEFNCWVQSPEKMLIRYISLAYPTDSSVPITDLAELRATVTAFEFDMVNSEAVLSMSYSLKNKQQRRRGSITVREKFASAIPSAMAEAMDQAADQASRELFETVSDILQGK